METLTRFVFALDGEGEKGIRVLFKALVTCASQTGAFQGVSLPKLSHLLLSIETATGQSGSAPVDAAFDIFLSQLRKHDVSQEGIVQSLLDLIARHAGLKFTVPFLRILRQRRLTLADPASLHQLVANELVAIRESSKVTEKARQHTAYALHICNTVSKLLSNISAIPATSTLQPQLDTLQAQRQLAHILTRAHIDHALPLAYRNVAANISVNDSVNLIHQLAHQYATNNTRTQREAWRAIYYLYRYLQQNSLPIDPLFSKAVVRASIIRPMSENRFVSARRVIWVSHLVARVEGEAVGKQIEADFWTWRGELIRHAKDVYVGVGGHRQDKAHIGTMKKLGLI
ncbi:hypothetical protein CC86DRAFT_290761 [Ophiobolus disseminans]|uniref:Uncharacterized protein n=1 Tax=Ophiobolus disseminans TaxID=1469910 RepID=A0A6A7A4A4_9PLEO|nr:hypothetical protein CC86DRAFT_290761 [Ophiobolus disseminans]